MSPRTLLISPFFDAALPSGGVLYSVDVVREWLARGRSVTLLCGRRERRLADLQDYVDAGQLTILPIVDDEQIRFTHHPDPRTYAAARDAIRAVAPDVIHVHNTHGMLSAVEAAIDSPAPVVATALDFSLICLNFYLYDSTGSVCPGLQGTGCCQRCISRTMHGSPRWLEPVLPRWATRRIWPRFVRLDQIKAAPELHALMAHVRRGVDAIIAPSPIMHEKMTAATRGANVCVREILYGVAPEKVLRPDKMPSEILRLAYLGSAERIKGLHVLIAMLESLPAGLPFEIRAIGNDAVRAAIVQTSAHVRSYLRYHPPLFGRELAAEHARIDAVLVPSLWYENSPFVVLESLANGTPVIASDQPGISHLITPGVNGELVRPGDPAAWRNALLPLIERPGRVRRMQTAARLDRTTADFVDDVAELESELLPAERELVPA